MTFVSLSCLKDRTVIHTHLLAMKKSIDYCSFAIEKEKKKKESNCFPFFFLFQEDKLTQNEDAANTKRNDQGR